MGIFTKYMIRLAAKLEGKHSFGAEFEKNLFRGEFTEQLEEYFQAIHENLVLLRRELAQGPLYRKHDEMQERDVVPELLQAVDQVTKLLKPGRFLKFDFAKGESIVERANSTMKYILYVLMDVKQMLPNSMRYAKEIIHDLDQSFDLLVDQSEDVEKHLSLPPRVTTEYFTTEPATPTRLREQVSRDIDEISPEEVHPDFSLHGGGGEHVDTSGEDEEDIVHEEYLKRLENEARQREMRKLHSPSRD